MFRSHMFRASSCLLFALACLPACGDDDPPAFDHAGLYAVDTWTQLSGSCEGEGEAQPEELTQTPLLIIDKVRFDIFGMTTVNVVAALCANEAECLERTNGEFFSLFGSLTFPTRTSQGAFVLESFSGWPREGNCDGTVERHELRFPEKGQARLERLDYEVSFPAKTVEGEPDCDFDDALRAAKSAPCSGKRSISASFQSAVPSRN